MNLYSEAEEKKLDLWGKGIFALCLLTWIYCVFFAASERHQGDVYRILYLHVPSAFTAFFSSLLLFITSITSLRSKDQHAVFKDRAIAEVGLIFTLITLFTGSVWGKPTWGVWWTWDARLTTTFILALLYCAYILLWTSIDQPIKRKKVCAVLGILIFADVPIIYKSVTWWRTLHQPPSMLRSGGSTMSGSILYLLVFCCFITILFGLWMIKQREWNLKLKNRIEQISLLG